MMMMMMGMAWQVASGIDWRGVYTTTYCINRGTFNVFIDGALT